jgi:transcriptional regulator with XRE-family HTH domain
MFDTIAFKVALTQNGYTQKKLAKEIGMSEQTLIRRIKRGVFGTDEVTQIINVLDIKDPTPIFFAPEVTYKVTDKRRDA